MQSGSRYIIATGIGLLALSILYFLSLVLFVPFLVTVPVIFVSLVFIFGWILKNAVSGADKIKHPAWAWVMLFAGVSVVVYRFPVLAVHYGGWDAWGIWNLHAKYLTDPVNWKKMFENIYFAHPEYPLFIPAVNGFFIRLFAGKYVMAIPFIFNFCMTLFIPVLIFLENVKKNIVVAGIFLFLFAADTFFLTKGATQYADTTLAFFFLCAFVCVNYADEDRKFVLLTAASAGCCVWIKDEGCILALIFIVFYSQTFFKKKNILSFAIGAGVPIAIYLIYKIGYAPLSGTMSEKDNDMLSHLHDWGRYKTVYHFFIDNVNKKFYYVKVLFFLYLIVCVVQRQWPGKQFLLIICCMAAYTMVYVTSSGSIEWLLDTSQERLMHQLMPALMYVFALRFSEIQFSLAQQKTE